MPLSLTLLLAAGEEIQCLLLVVAPVAAVRAVMGPSWDVTLPGQAVCTDLWQVLGFMRHNTSLQQLL